VSDVSGRIRQVQRIATIVLAVAGCAAEGDVISAGDDADPRDVEEVEPEDLVPVLVVESDGVGATSYGPLPMTSENPGEDDYYQEPPTMCEDRADVEVLGPDDMYAYLGDGGDYLFIDHWVTGEPAAEASDRFEDGVGAIEACLDESFEQVDVRPRNVDDVRRYDSETEDARASLLYARNGGVITLLFVESLSEDRYDGDDIDRLVDVALDKLASLGGVEVAA
jgi:hypothetical protein